MTVYKVFLPFVSVKIWFKYLHYYSSKYYFLQFLTNVWFFYSVNYVNVNYCVKYSTIDSKYLLFLQDSFFKLKPIIWREIVRKLIDGLESLDYWIIFHVFWMSKGVLIFWLICQFSLDIFFLWIESSELT